MASINLATGIASDLEGNIYFGDSVINRIRVVSGPISSLFLNSPNVPIPPKNVAIIVIITLVSFFALAFFGVVIIFSWTRARRNQRISEFESNVAPNSLDRFSGIYDSRKLNPEEVTSDFDDEDEEDPLITPK